MQVKVQEGHKGFYKGLKTEGETFTLDHVRDFSPVWMTPVKDDHDQMAAQAQEIKGRIYEEANGHSVRRLSREREDAIEAEIVNGGKKQASRQSQKKGEGAGSLAE